jgi:plasmid stabilization system protein ParE
VKPVRYDAEAEEEYLATVRWYRARNRQAAERFMDRVIAAETLIREHPEAWGSPPGVAPEVGARRVIVRGFPFALVYVELEQEIRIIAVAHSKRRPGYWRGRV